MIISVARRLLITPLIAAALASAQTQVDLQHQARGIDFTASSYTKPIRMGSALPASCGVGEAYLLTSAAAGANVYICLQANQWTAQSQSPSGGTVGGASSLVLANAVNCTTSAGVIGSCQSSAILPGLTVTANAAQGATVLPLGIVSTTAYSNHVVAVPTPATAPVLLAQTHISGSGQFASGKSYQFAYSLLGWSGETSLSPPTSSFTGTGVGLYSIAFPGLPSSGAYVGIQIYIQDLTDTPGAWYKACVAPCTYPLPTTLVQPGDVSNTFAGVPASYATSLGIYSGTNNAVDAGGTAIAAPTAAPTIMPIGTLPASTTFYGAYSYLAGDNTETALSPVSGGVTTSDAAGNWLTFRHPTEPPSGAVKVCDYLSTDGATFQEQGCFPLHYVTHDIYSYNSSGNPNSPGTSLSTVSPLQQAIDAAQSIGATKVWFPAQAGPINRTVPLLLRTNVGSPGLIVECTGTNDLGLGKNSNCRTPYTGTISGVEGLVSFATNTIWRGIDVQDPNALVAYGLAMADFTNGEGFWNTWERSSFQARQAGGIGCIIDVFGRGSASHSASEQYYHFLGCNGDGWGYESHGQQVEDIRGVMLNTNSVNSTSSANSGELRLFETPISIFGHQHGGNGAGRYTFLITGEPAHPLHGSTPNSEISESYSELTSSLNAVNVAVSSLSTAAVPTVFTLRNSRATNGTGHRIYALLNETDSYVNVENPKTENGDIYMNYGAGVPLNDGTRQARLIVQGAAVNFGWGGSFENISPFYNQGSVITTSAPIVLQNETGQQSQITTNTQPGIVFGSLSGGITAAFPTAGGMQLAGQPLAAIPATAGTLEWCNNCNVASPCTSGGSGAWCFVNAAGTKNCPF